MQTKKTITREAEVVDKTFCNKCSKEMPSYEAGTMFDVCVDVDEIEGKVEEMLKPYNVYDKDIKFYEDHEYVTASLRFDICKDCAKEFIASFTIKPTAI